MKKQTEIKNEKKELKNHLIETIEKALSLDTEDKKAKKLKKVIKDAAKQISKKYMSKVKDRKARENQPNPTVLKRRNQRITAQKKESEAREDIKL